MHKQHHRSAFFRFHLQTLGLPRFHLVISIVDPNEIDAADNTGCKHQIRAGIAYALQTAHPVFHILKSAVISPVFVVAGNEKYVFPLQKFAQKHHIRRGSEINQVASVQEKVAVCLRIGKLLFQRVQYRRCCSAAGGGFDELRLVVLTAQRQMGIGDM